MAPNLELFLFGMNTSWCFGSLSSLHEDPGVQGHFGFQHFPEKYIDERQASHTCWRHSHFCSRLVVRLLQCRITPRLGHGNFIVLFLHYSSLFCVYSQFQMSQCSARGINGLSCLRLCLSASTSFKYFSTRNSPFGFAFAFMCRGKWAHQIFSFASFARHQWHFIGPCVFWNLMFGSLAIFVHCARLRLLASAFCSCPFDFHSWVSYWHKDIHQPCRTSHLCVQEAWSPCPKEGSETETFFDLCFWFVVSTVVWKDALPLATDDTTLFAFSVRPIDRETSWHVCFRSEGDSAPFGSMLGRCNFFRGGHSQYLESRGFNSPQSLLDLLSPYLPEVLPDPAHLWYVAPLPATIAQCSVHSSRHVLSHDCRGVKYDPNTGFCHGSRSHFFANSCA